MFFGVMVPHTAYIASELEYVQLRFLYFSGHVLGKENPHHDCPNTFHYLGLSTLTGRKLSAIL